MAHSSTDYDLAILGGSLSSRLAACTAAQKGARVILIAPNWRVVDATQCLLEALYSSCDTTDPLPWPTLCDWVHYRCEHPLVSPAVLRSQGIDVILDSASFTQKLDVKLTNRYLKASRYLLTDGYGTSTFNMAQSSLLCHQLVQLGSIPERIGVMGKGASAVEWAYALSRVVKVKLVLLDQQLLPAEDWDIQRLSEAQLRSLGIEVVFLKDYSDVGVTQIEPRQLNVDMLVTVSQPYDWGTLGLKKIGLPTSTPVTVNRYLQTRCSQVYASGGSLGGENRPELTQQETTIALRNALFGKWYSMYYEQVFYTIRLLSPIGRWGLTERQAKGRYGYGVEIFQASCLPERAENIAETNFCKLITLGQQLLGVHLMGDGAPTLIAALGSCPNIQTLSQWATAGFQPATLHDAIYQAVKQWRSNRWSEGQWRRDLAENWFNWRRSL